MKIQITSDNISVVSPSMEALAHEKLEKLTRKLSHVYDDAKSFRVVINSAPDDKFIAKVHALIHGKEYFAECSEYTLEHALISCIEEIDRKLQKEKVVAQSEDWEETRDAKRLIAEEEAEEI